MTADQTMVRCGVVPGSHRFGRLDGESAIAKRQHLGEVICEVSRGSALLMHPLLLHASSKLLSANRRRVLHFLFGPPILPFGLKWGHAV
jgi:ectoine hydroxylase-related dioxygenase (phytanoyl-CoA dioxygenase family)